MKKIGQYTARGICTEAQTEAGEPQKITLFDGRFDTGYRITNFKIWSANYGSSSGPDVVGKLSTKDNDPTDTVNFMRADNTNQIAWAASAGSTDGGLGFGEGPIIDRDNLVIEDLYVYVRSAGTQTVNYLVEMDKYEITDWQGALAMARDAADEQ